MSKLRKYLRARRLRDEVKAIADEVFAIRAEHFQHECGWCGESIGDEVIPLFGKALPGADLSPVQGKVIEMIVGDDRHVLAGVCAFDSPAKAEGHDFLFTTCSEECARELSETFASEVAANRLRIC